MPKDLSISTAGLSIFVKTLGAVHKPKGRQLNWYVLFFILKRRRCRNWEAIGTMKNASFRSTFAIQLFLLRSCVKALHLEML